ncbi:hypothetical protein CHUAL_005714 [Chamberlinius hualienensis]
MPVSEELREGCQNNFNFKQKYKNLKRKFRYLIYENECFQEELKRAHRRLLKVNQDKSFLLDRLLQYEKIEDTSSDSDGTISSDSDLDNFSMKKKRSTTSTISNSHGFPSTSNPPNTSRSSVSEPSAKRDGHMTSEEIERHLESRRTLLDLVPERAPPTVPTEMFSSDLSCIDKLLADD